MNISNQKQTEKAENSKTCLKKKKAPNAKVQENRGFEHWTEIK